MHYLKGKRVYLSAPIQYGIEGGWREMVTNVLVNEMEINLFDPFTDPKQQWLPELMTAKKDRDTERMVKIAKSFVMSDLSNVAYADFVVAYVPHKVPTTGTTHEIIYSNDAKKPTLLVTNTGDITDIPLWYYGFISLEFMFADWENLFAYLREVDRGEHAENYRWNFIYNANKL